MKNTTTNSSNQIIINANSSASSSKPIKVKKQYSLAFDLVMIVLTRGWWIIWMIIRPGYC